MLDLIHFTAIDISGKTDPIVKTGFSTNRTFRFPSRLAHSGLRLYKMDKGAKQRHAPAFG